MQVCELITLLREDLLDDAVKEYLWPDSALLRIINEAQRQACSRGDYLFDTFPFSIAATSARYPLDPRITRITRILVDGVEIHRRTRHERDEQTQGWRQATTGDCVAVISGRTIQFDPIPQANASVVIEGYRLPNKLETCGDELEIIQEYQADLVHWCVYRCYSKVDADTYDPVKAKEHLAQFDAIFGKVVPANVRQHQLEAEHAAMFRPISYTSSRTSFREEW